MSRQVLCAYWLCASWLQSQPSSVVPESMEKEKWEYKAFGDKAAAGFCDLWMSLQLFLLGGVGAPGWGQQGQMLGERGEGISVE